MADRPVRPRHRPGAKRISPEPVGDPRPPEPVEATEATEATEVVGHAQTGAVEAVVPEQARLRASPDPSDTWRLRPRGMVAREVRDRWNEAQGEFVDDPARSVREADALASEVADAVIAEVEARRAELRSAWGNAGTGTEELRLALRDYRSFVRRMVGDD